MNLVNVGLYSLGAKVISCTSTINNQFKIVQNILNNDDASLWQSGQGLPQEIILDLQKVSTVYMHVISIGFKCWHSYNSNPKTIQLWSSPQQDAEYIHWQTFGLQKIHGQQTFHITALPSSYRIIKLVILETYGEFHTYLNQICIYVEPNNIHPAAESDLLQMSNLSHNSQIYDENDPIWKLGDKMSEMEDKVLELQRHIDILELRMKHSYESLQNNVLKKVQSYLSQYKQTKQQNYLRPTTRSSKKQRTIDRFNKVEYQNLTKKQQNEKKRMKLSDLASTRNRKQQLIFLLNQLNKKLKIREQFINQLNRKKSKYQYQQLFQTLQ